MRQIDKARRAGIAWITVLLTLLPIVMTIIFLATLFIGPACGCGGA